MGEKPRSDGERDEQLSSIYRAVPAEAPPPALDDAIRAAARREVGARPRRAGAPFARWQMPLSIAAVLVLCVSLVVLMRDEGGELTQVPRAEAPAPAAREGEAAPGAGVVPKIELVPEASRSKNIGFKASTPTAGTPAAGADAYALAKPGVSSGLRKPVPDVRDAKRGAEPDTSITPGQRPLASAFPEKKERGVADQLEHSAAANAGKLQARRDAAPAAESAPAGAVAESRSRGPAENAAAPAVGGVASVVEPARVLRQGQAAEDRAPARAEAQSMARPAPAAPAAMRTTPAAAEPSTMPQKSASETADLIAQMTRLPPDKWLERIDELQRQGRVEEARAGLAEFRKRYPDYALPPALRNLAQP